MLRVKVIELRIELCVV